MLTLHFASRPVLVYSGEEGLGDVTGWILNTCSFSPHDFKAALLP